ncbi:MAG: bifunctional nuclease family protein [Verrucomicrobia bacterium]|nr:bifunctional nuclease family protein [Verrucomicrobiota bacterium]
MANCTKLKGLAVAGLLCGGIFLWRTADPQVSDKQKAFSQAEVSTVGMDLLTGSPLVLLRDLESGQVVPIWVGFAEAQAIARSLHGVRLPRPMTHDLMASLLQELEAKVEEVLVHDVREGTYYGAIRLRRPGEERIREVDSRPSDALALALRVGAPIQVARDILKKLPDYDFRAPDEAEQVVRVVGVTVVAATAALRKEFDLGDREGVVVAGVSEEAGKKGLKRGDLIVRVNDRVAKTPMEFLDAVRETPAGKTVRFLFWREGKEKEIELPLRTPPRPTPRGQFEA